MPPAAMRSSVVVTIVSRRSSSPVGASAARADAGPSAAGTLGPARTRRRPGRRPGPTQPRQPRRCHVRAVAPSSRVAPAQPRSAVPASQSQPVSLSACWTACSRRLLPGVGHGGQHLVEAGHAAAQPRRPVRAAEERLPLGRQEHRQRPAALAGHHLHRFHVDLVQVGTLLAVHLDPDEVLVQQPGDLRVLEALVGHHVAPVAGRVADRQEDRLLLGLGGLQRLRTPRVPVHGVLGVLEQIGTIGLGESIGHLRLPSLDCTGEPAASRAGNAFCDDRPPPGWINVSPPFG